jgi:hypothetical protein
MLNSKFYWGTIRKAIVAFGNTFNNIHIDRKDENSDVIQTLKVPLSYAPTQKFLARIKQLPNPDTEVRTEVVLPRMSFEMTSIQYDPSRKIAPTQANRVNNTSTVTQTKQFAPAPYNMGISLYLYSRNQHDALQIVEQILPYFNPDFNLTLKAVPDLNIKNDLPIILDGINYEDDYENDFMSRRMIIWTLNFTLKLNFYGPVDRQGIIRTAVANTYSNEELTNQQTGYTVSVYPTTAKPGDTIDYTETFEDF